MSIRIDRHLFKNFIRIFNFWQYFNKEKAIVFFSLSISTDELKLIILNFGLKISWNNVLYNIEYYQW